MKNLDGLRGIAIALVLLTHFGAPWPTTTHINRVVSNVLGVGWCGVDLFFVLSGFLITGILLDTRGAENWWSSFFMRRVLRIFPLYYLALFVLVSFSVLRHGAAGAGSTWWYWTYLGNWSAVAGQESGAFPHFWSLGVEEQFYLLWPALILFAGPKRLPLVACAIVIAGPVIRFALLHSQWPPIAVYHVTPARMDQLALGALVASAMRHPVRRNWIRRGWAAATLVAMLIFIVGGLTNGGFAFNNARFEVVGDTVLGIAFAALVSGAVFSEWHDVLLTRFLCWRPLQRLGKYSYGIYIVHYPIHAYAMTLWLRSPRLTAFFQRPAGCVAYIAVGGVFTYLVAVATFELVERRFLSLKQHFAPRFTTRVEAAAAALSTGPAAQDVPTGSRRTSRLVLPET